MKKLHNIEAMRALQAFKFAETGNAEQSEGFNYSAAVQELPSMIRMNGLRATMAYFYSKEKHHGLVFKQIRDWFREFDPVQMIRRKFSEEVSKPDAKKKELALSREEAKEFMNILLNLTDDEYRIVQAETLTLSNWLIRFVKTEDSKSKIVTHDTGQPQA